MNERLKSAFDYSANHYPQSGVRIENKLSKEILEGLVEKNKNIEKERVKALREENEKREIEISKRIKVLKKKNKKKKHVLDTESDFYETPYTKRKLRKLRVRIEEMLNLKAEMFLQVKKAVPKRRVVIVLKQTEPIVITKEQSKLSFEEYLQQKEESQKEKIKELNKKIF